MISLLHNLLQNKATRKSSIVCTLLCWLALAFTALKARHDPNRCQSLLNNGRWLRNPKADSNSPIWQPIDCLIHTYDSSDIQQCLQNQKLYFVGDSTARKLFWATAKKIDNENAKNASFTAEKHTNHTYNVMNMRLEFVWDPYWNTTMIWSILQNASAEYKIKGVILSAGLWHARYLGEDYLSAYRKSLTKMASGIVKDTRSQIQPVMSYKEPALIFCPPPFPSFEALNPERAKTLTSKRMTDLIATTRDFEQEQDIEVAWTNFLMTFGQAAMLDDSGIHLNDPVPSLQANILLNRLCNQVLQDQGHRLKATCCITRSYGTAYRWVLPTSLIALTFMQYGFIIRHTWWAQNSKVGSTLKNLRGIATLMAALTLSYAADRTSMFSAAAKPTSTSCFICITLVILLCGVRIMYKTACPPKSSLANSDNVQDIPLSRQQTEEWKGWMQIVILLYHYFGISQVLWVYKIARVLVGSYLFLTGYGHASYFLKTKDFSLQRVVTVLVRLNLLACSLAFIMNTTYDFYYFPGLASLWFLIIYTTLLPTGSSPNLSQMALRVCVSCCLLNIILKSPGALEVMLTMLHHIGGPAINHHEFRFRVSLDLFAPYAGVLVAAIQREVYRNETLTQWRILRNMRNSSNGAYMGRLAATIMIISVALIILTPHFSTKIAYNEWHPFISLVPILAFIVLRNCNRWARQLYSPVLAWFGRCSLETFVLQYHIWLAADTRGVLRLNLIDRPSLSSSTTLSSWSFWMETAIITVFFVQISGLVADASIQLTKQFVGEAKEFSKINGKQTNNLCGSQIKVKSICSLQKLQSLKMRIFITVFLMWLANVLWTKS